MVRTIIFEVQTADEVETDGRGTNRETNHDADNVVPFPREWIGPPEELIPIGPSASPTAAEDDEELGRTLGADAFWGERAACLHEPIEAPAPVAESERRLVAAEFNSPRPGPREPPAPSVDASESAPRVSRHRGGVLLGRTSVLALGLVVAAVLVTGVALAGLDGSHPRAASLAKHLPSHPAPSQGVDAAAVSRLERLTAMRMADALAARVAVRRAQRARRAVNPPARGKSGHSSSRSPVSLTVSYSPAERSVVSATATGGAIASPSVSSQPASSQGTPSTSPTTGSASSSSSGGSGPTGPGAPFGPGQMGSASG